MRIDGETLIPALTIVFRDGEGKISPSSEVATIDLTTTEGLWDTTSLAVDTSGNIFIAPLVNNDGNARLFGRE